MKFLGTPILKNICERLLLVVGWRITYKLSRRNLLLLTCLVYINIYVTSSFSSFICGFLIHMCFGFDETELSYKGKIIWRTSAGSKIQIERTRLHFQTAPTKIVMRNLKIKILYILSLTVNDKDRLQHLERQIWLVLKIFQRG